jgi:hypothetical protein
MNSLVFEVEQLQRDVLAAFTFPVHLEPIRLWPTRSEFLFGPREQSRLNACVIEVVG